MYSYAITLGVKPTLRKDYNDRLLYLRALNLMQSYNPTSLIISLEPYKDKFTKGDHVHIYMVTDVVIFWKEFNIKWSIGYVNNRKIYDITGWINYITKQSRTHYVLWSPDDVKEESIIERFTGLKLKDCIVKKEEYDEIDLIKYQTSSDDELSLE